MANVEALRPPPGVVPDFVHPVDHRKAITTVNALGLTLITVLITVRFYTRHFITGRLGWDDWTCLLAYILLIPVSGLILECQTYGFGRHLWDVPISWMTMLLKLLWASELLIIPLLLFLKVSFLLFYGRIFSPDPMMKILTRLGVASCIIFYTAIFFRSLFLCDPVKKIWIPLEPGSCLNPLVMPYASGFFNVVSDLYILVLPMPFIWRLHIKTGRKIKLVAIFSFGAFACASSIVRLVTTFQTIGRPDVTWYYATLSIWSSLEMMVGIICSCFLALPAFIDHYFPQDFAHYMSKISSLFSTKDSSEPPTKYNDRKLHRSKSTAYNHSTGSHGVDEYTELGEEIEPPMNLENLQPHKATSLNTTNVTGGSSNQDTEALALDGIWKTVKVHQSYLIDTKKPDSS